ncbi:META domain-containing protein [Flagellimonas zhangzhouensis]|uniref:META domain-containing protein n=1 Tax=Flagellimonas zhangzhouensis TaxID=1073328 RepID=A0A1H2V552_9FLAO|nr:META domain-containing protein [Allomuricauda zhangzhouensis]SDQ10734.1 META domain-containing protein [Allomuricauda zhangzhouensis]SDW63452.1 META domain-containing protein [Allomuricauda zhangzhouensis]
MKKLLFALTALFLFSNCVERKKETPSELEAQPFETSVDTMKKEIKRTIEPLAFEPDGSYFSANGTEPFWGLKLYGDKVELKTMEDTIMTPPTEAIKAQDGNISMYRIKTEATEMDVIIAHKPCTNAMSGEEFTYTVTVSYKSTGGGETVVYEGCGSYITDYRLHDIWVLESMKGTTVSKEDFNEQDVPNMEVNVNSNRFSGFSGCNRMTGSLFFENGLLRFTQIAGTRMACPSMEKESEFLTALQASTTYKVENNRLYLSNPNEENLLVFKKID